MNKEELMKSKKTIFVTATNTDVGKTFACEKLLNFYANKGYKVGYFKPIETGVADIPLDGSKLLALAKKLNPIFDVQINDVVTYQFNLPASPFVAKENIKIDLKLLKAKQEKLQKLCDVLIIEGAGGLLVPIKKDFFMIDLIKLFDAKTVLISPSNLGSINDTLLSMEALKNRGIQYKWYINLHKDKESFETVSLPFYKAKFKKLRFL